MVDIAVILVGIDVDLHSSVFDRAAAFGIPILHCDWKGVPTSATLPWSDNTRVAARHVAQASMELPRRKNAWMRIVRAKIRGQAVNLRPIGDESAKYLLDLAVRVRSGDPANCEGQAARYYWRRVFGDMAFRRVAGNRQGANGMLDYGYAILRGVTLRGVVSAGLWPSLGLWHHNRSNCFALVDDIIEPFRPVVDATVVTLLRQVSSLDRAGKHALSGVLDRPYSSDGYTVGTAIIHLAQNVARYIEGDIKVLEVPHFEGWT